MYTVRIFLQWTIFFSVIYGSKLEVTKCDTMSDLSKAYVLYLSFWVLWYDTKTSLYLIASPKKFIRLFEPWLTSNLYKYPKLSHYSQMVSHCMFQASGTVLIGLWRTKAHTHMLTVWWSTKQIMFACTFSTHQTFRYSFIKCYFRW